MQQSKIVGRYLTVTRVSDPTLPGPEISAYFVPDPTLYVRDPFHPYLVHMVQWLCRSARTCVCVPPLTSEVFLPISRFFCSKIELQR